MALFKHSQATYTCVLLMLICPTSVTVTSGETTGTAEVESFAPDEKNNGTRQLAFAVSRSLNTSFLGQEEITMESNFTSELPDLQENILNESTVAAVVSLFTETYLDGAHSDSLSTSMLSSEVPEDETKNLSTDSPHSSVENTNVAEINEKAAKLLTEAISKALKTIKEILLKLSENSTSSTNVPNVNNRSVFP
uniref:Uncharacterized protein n=1 Tax=Trichuris muris TaxID=70415 RepID=A0A5S6R104_TRIMR